MNGQPTSKVEIDHMRHSMHHTFSGSLLNLGEQFQAAVDQATTPERIQNILDTAATKEIECAIREETRKFFQTGPGRDLVAREVIKRLSEDLDLTTSPAQPQEQPGRSHGVLTEPCGRCGSELPTLACRVLMHDGRVSPVKLCDQCRFTLRNDILAAGDPLGFDGQ